MLATLLMLIVVILLLLAAFGVNLGRVNPGWLGLALWAFTILFPALGS